MIKAVIFDLDDTLYDEFTYVQSGFEKVSVYIENKYSVSKSDFFNSLINDLKRNGRGHTFNNVLTKFNIYDEGLVYKLVHIYQRHKPNIKLYSNAEELLIQIKKIGKKTGIITDGTSIMQKNKVESLGIKKYMDVLIYTDEYGIEYWKPNTFSFEKCLKEFSTKPKEMVYIGDNPKKDFYGANKLSINTIRILKGSYSNSVVKKEYDADFYINELDEVLKLINSIE